MSTDAETRFMEIWQENHDDHYTAHSMNVQDATIHQFLTEYAVIPRPDMPVLDERGEASDEWWEETVKTEGADRRRHYAAYSLARAEWFEAREAAEAETKLSERRNKVLREVRAAGGSSYDFPYEEASPFGKAAVDMIIEAQDEAGK